MKTARTTSLRERDRMSYDRDVIDSILDEAWHCTLSFVADGEPRALPTLHVRIGDTVYIHGSTGSRPLLHARDGGLRVCLSATLIDGIVLSRSHFHHSANYRSVVAHGVATLVESPSEKERVLNALVEKIGAGRSAQSRPPAPKELAQTAVLALRLDEVSARQRTGGVVEDENDLDLPYWAGVLPLTLTAGRPIPDEGVTVPQPAYLFSNPWLEPVVMRGRHVILEPLQTSHVDELFAALGNDEEVWRFTTTPTPRSRDDMAAYISKALSQGTRCAWLQRDARTGAAAGTTSLYPDERVPRAGEIGATILARSAWRTGINTEAKLMLLERCFDVLGAIRVSWQTDVLNQRSQRAIERLGAQREGVLRANRYRPDGTLRDSVIYSMLASEWPVLRSALRARLGRN
jgi:RimJ/RimL family protein N-acetyltransferase/nitroimidazol reductase NimA-like FMN-containing flavoprotein (pyridoxamine 5'-phosphate oxidase superfamily)